MTIPSHRALSEQKISHKSTRSGKRQPPPNLKNRLRFWFQVAWLVSVALVLWQGSSTSPAELTMRINDKIGHAITFFLLGLWGLLAWKQTGQKKGLLVFLSIYGLLIECIQYYVPNRYFSAADWGADLLGLMFSVLCYRYIARKYGTVEKIAFF